MECGVRVLVCMLYLNHVVAVVVVEEPIYKGRSIQETESGRSSR